MKRIYIAGPYSADNVMDILKNIREGIRVSTEVMKMGYSPFCPWLDYHFVLMDFGDKLKVEDFYRYSLDWLAVSDAVIVIGEWLKSKGTIKEIEFARKNNIPIYWGFYDFEKSN
jgi:hypothetical protein